MNGFFVMWSPTVDDWLEKMVSKRTELLDARPQMQAVLERTRIDVESQFTGKQGEWKPLATYTIEKKERMDADPRILHETKIGEGLTLRETWGKTGHVTEQGVLEFTYPAEKPYAKDHQEGATIDSPDRKTKQYYRKPSKRELSDRKRETKRLDDEYDRIMGNDRY